MIFIPWLKGLPDLRPIRDLISILGYKDPSIFGNAGLLPLVHQHRIFILPRDGVNSGYSSSDKWPERPYCSLWPKKDFPILQRLIFAVPLLRWKWYPQHLSWSLISYLLLRAQIFHWDIGRRSEICIPSWIALKTVLLQDPSLLLAKPSFCPAWPLKRVPAHALSRFYVKILHILESQISWPRFSCSVKCPLQRPKEWKPPVMFGISWMPQLLDSDTVELFLFQGLLFFMGLQGPARGQNVNYLWFCSLS